MTRIRINGQELIYFSDLRAVGKQSINGRFILSLSLLSMAGVPPFAGFFGKFLVLQSILEDIYILGDPVSYFLAIVGILVTILIAYYYLRLIVWLYSDISENKGVLVFDNKDAYFKATEFVTIITLMVGTAFWMKYILLIATVISDLYVT
jgi:NADH-quinone oxidoreductase subunit N